MTTQLEEKILTLNLNNKKGVNILKRRYDHVKDSILSILTSAKQITMTELGKKVSKNIGSSFDGKVGWYFMAVKLDLEERGLIERIPNTTPQMLRIKK
jgi:hypothetical protein